MSSKKKIGIVGGGAAGTALAWTLTKDTHTSTHCDVVVFHDEDRVGGHSKTINVWFDSSGKGFDADSAPAPTGATTYPVDIGVQFICPTLYPNVYAQLEKFFPEVTLQGEAELKMSTSFGPTHNWGNFPSYRKDEARFERCNDAETLRLEEQFQRDLKWGPLAPLDGLTFSTTVDEYLTLRNIPRDSAFFRYLLIPYLCIFNGYGTTDLLDMTFQDLYPIFVKIPGLQKLGPYASFLEPGKGWDRFAKGASQWVEAMADASAPATFKRGMTVLGVYPISNKKTRVEYAKTAEVKAHFADPSAPPPTVLHEDFDEVVLTTDMTTNRKLLDRPENKFYPHQRDYIAADRFVLIPGVCYIHQDDECLSPYLRDKLEDGQFVGAYSTSPRPGGNPFDLDYNLESSFQTYLMKNILGTPYDCHVSMYSIDETAKTPDPSKVIHKKEWLHGRWVASFFEKAKKELHYVQGLGNIWFAGNNTTLDSEEGALVSALVIANRLFPDWTYPFDLTSEAYVMFKYFEQMMFPTSFSAGLRSVFHDIEEMMDEEQATS